MSRRPAVRQHNASTPQQPGEFPRLDRLRRLGETVSAVIDAWRPAGRAALRALAILAASNGVSRGLSVAVEIAHRVLSGWGS